MVSIYLQNTAINSNTPVKILGESVRVSGKRNNIMNPDLLGTDETEVQTNTFENLKYDISGVHLTGDSNTLNYTDVLTLYTQKYNGNNYSLLTITYGNSILPNLSAQTSGIKVILDSFVFPLSAKDTKNGYLPIGTLNFIGTK